MAVRTRQILKFTKDGKFLMQVGKSGARRKAGAAADANGEGLAAGFAGEFATTRTISAASPRSSSMPRKTKPISPTVT